MIIINADDFGLTVPINNSIAQLAQNNLVTSATLLTSGDAHAFNHAVSLVKRTEIPTGLHLDLDHFFFFDETGHYGQHENDIIADYKSIVSKNKKAIISDIEKQFDMIAKTGITISHIDSHHSIHLFPEIMELLLPVMRDLSINKLRFASQFYQQDSTRSKATKLLAEHNIHYPDCFIDLGSILHDNISLPADGITEIMAHTCATDNSMGRVDQFDFLKSNPFKGINKGSFWDL